VELAGVRKDVAFACEQFPMSERRACKLMEVDRSTYRYEPRPDHNAALRQALVELARQKPRYGYRRLQVVLEKRGHRASVMRIYRLYRAEGLMVRRLRRKRLSRVPVASDLVGPIRSGRWISPATLWRRAEASVFYPGDRLPILATPTLFRSPIADAIWAAISTVVGFTIGTVMWTLAGDTPKTCLAASDARSVVAAYPKDFSATSAHTGLFP
jgi:putative transposase